MKAIMLSIQPKWCELIANGKKTVEVRKTAPYTRVKCYMYCTSIKKMSLSEYVEIHRRTGGKIDDWNSKVIGEFVVDRIETFTVGSLRSDDLQKSACLSYEALINYFYKPNELDGETTKIGYGWHISDLKIYDQPKELSEFKKTVKKCTNGVWYRVKEPLTRPPQSWGYVEELSE